MQGNTRGRAGVLAMMAAALGAMGRAATGAAESTTKLNVALGSTPESITATDADLTLRIPNYADSYYPMPGTPRFRFRGKPHRNPTPHRGTSRRANRAAKRRKLRARAR